MVLPVMRLPSEDPPVADAARHRRPQFGEFEIELGGGDGCLARPHRRFGDPLGLGALIEGLLRDGAIAHQLGATIEVGLGKDQVGAGLLEVGHRLVEGGLVRALVQREQQVALLDHLAVGKVDSTQVPGNSGTDFDTVDGNKPPDIFVAIDDGTLDGLLDRDGRGWWGRRLLPRTFTAACQRENKNEQGCARRS